MIDVNESNRVVEIHHNSYLLEQANAFVPFRRFMRKLIKAAPNIISVMLHGRIRVPLSQRLISAINLHSTLEAVTFDTIAQLCLPLTDLELLANNSLHRIRLGSLDLQNEPTLPTAEILETCFRSYGGMGVDVLVGHDESKSQIPNQCVFGGLDRIDISSPQALPNAASISMFLSRHPSLKTICLQQQLRSLQKAPRRGDILLTSLKHLPWCRDFYDVAAESKCQDVISFSMLQLSRISECAWTAAKAVMFAKSSDIRILSLSLSVFPFVRKLRIINDSTGPANIVNF